MACGGVLAWWATSGVQVEALDSPAPRAPEAAGVDEPPAVVPSAAPNAAPSGQPYATADAPLYVRGRDVFPEWPELKRPLSAHQQWEQESRARVAALPQEEQLLAFRAARAEETRRELALIDEGRLAPAAHMAHELGRLRFAVVPLTGTVDPPYPEEVELRLASRAMASGAEAFDGPIAAARERCAGFAGRTAEMDAMVANCLAWADHYAGGPQPPGPQFP